MKKEQFYELLGDVDEAVIKAAETPPVTPIRHWRIGMIAVACLSVVLGVGIWYNSTKTPFPNTSNESKDLSSEQDVALEQKDVNIYYYKSNEMLCTAEYLPCEPKEIFNSWKSYNGIGDEVQLIDVKIANNGTESVDSSTAGYSVGDTFILNVTITENIKDYYAIIPEEELLESLKLTLIGYHYIEFDEYNLILE